MRNLFRRWGILGGVFFLAASGARADRFVRPEGAVYGAGNGTTWTDAWSGFSAVSWGSIPCGETLWVAGGLYRQSLVPGKTGCSAAAPLTIARARSDAAGATGAPGWSPAFDATVRHQRSIEFNSAVSWVRVSGRTVAGGRGWWLDLSGATGGAGVAFNAGRADNNTIEYMDLQGPGEINYTSDGRAIDCTPPSAASGNVFSRLRIFDWESGIYAVGCPNIIVEYVDMYDIAPLNWVTYHPNGIITWGSPNGTVRFCAFHKGPNGLGIGEGVFFEQAGGSTGWKIYGNLFYDLDSTGWKAIEIASPVGPIQIYNNTFDNILAGTIYTTDAWSCGSGSEFRNNLAISTGLTGCGTSSDNATVAAEAFVSRVAKNYRLAAPQPGAALAAAFERDPDGALRGGDGVWDMGVYEFGGAGDPTPPAAPRGLGVQ